MVGAGVNAVVGFPKRGGGTIARRIAIAIAVGVGSSAMFAACSVFRGAQPAAPLPASSAPVVESSQPKNPVIGIASWYGPGFDGRPTSSGKIYNQEELTAASNVFPLGSRVMVTNLSNGRAVEVAVTDHGPFKKGRKIDLSHKAARVIGMVGDGTAPVRIDLISKPAGSREVGTPPRYFVQLGSFSQRQNADRLRESLAASFTDVRVDRLDAGKLSYYRVRMGAFATREQAETRASDTARFGLPIVIVSE